jgi:hypothetical protein
MTSGPRPDMTRPVSGAPTSGSSRPLSPTDSHRLRDRLDAISGRRYPTPAPHSERANLSHYLDAGHSAASKMSAFAALEASLRAGVRAVAPFLQRQRGRGPGQYERDLAHAIVVVEVHAEARVDELGEREARRAGQAHR